jgi:Divergent InlB B-repeat domain
MRTRYAWRALLILSLVAVAALLPGAAESRPPESDGSTYTWTGAATLTVDVKPWGGGYVRSDPYLIDCPMACTRSFEQNRDVTLTAYTTPGHKFESWEGACAGQGNPCKLKLSGAAATDVTAVYSGQFVPPTPPPSAPSAPSPPVVLNPSLEQQTEGLDTTLIGTGYHADSPISISFEYSSPVFSEDFPNVLTSDASGSWAAGYTETCEFGAGPYSGPIEVDVTATDAEGATASTHVSTVCP